MIKALQVRGVLVPGEKAGEIQVYDPEIHKDKVVYVTAGALAQVERAINMLIEEHNELVKSAEMTWLSTSAAVERHGRAWVSERITALNAMVQAEKDPNREAL